MHPDETAIGLPLVARLIAAQFPQWGHRPLTEVRSAGTDNAVRMMQTIGNVDFDVIVKFDSIPTAAYSNDGIIVEATGDWSKISALIELLRPIGIREIVRTGAVAIGRLSEEQYAEESLQSAVNSMQ